MRNAFVLAFLANLILTTASLAILPDRVAIHFGYGGMPDGWSSSLSSALLTLGIHTLVFLSLYFSSWLIARAPNKWISFPNRDYWLAPEHRTDAIDRFSEHLWRFGTAVFLFMLVVSLLTIKANLSEPVRLDERWFLTALGLFFGYTVYWIVALVRAFRVPKKR